MHASKWKDIAAFVTDNAHPLILLISLLCFHPDFSFIDYSIWCVSPSCIIPFILMCFPIPIWNVSPLINLYSICYASTGLTCTFITPDVLPQLTFTPCDVVPMMYLYHSLQQDLPLSHLMSPSEMDSENPGLFTSWISWPVQKKKT